MAPMTSYPPRPHFVIAVAVEPRFRADQTKLLAALVARAAEDPSFGFSHDAESGQIMLKGIDEDHLDRTCSALQRDLDIVLGAPVVAYRETLKRRVQTPADYFGSNLGDLRGRRGKVVNDNSQDDACAVTALVPFANLFGNANQLRSFSEGYVLFTLRFSHYAPASFMPPGRDGPPLVAALRA